jgi:hypothetical protein
MSCFGVGIFQFLKKRPETCGVQTIVCTMTEPSLAIVGG